MNRTLPPRSQPHPASPVGGTYFKHAIALAFVALSVFGYFIEWLKILWVFSALIVGIFLSAFPNTLEVLRDAGIETLACMGIIILTERLWDHPCSLHLLVQVGRFLPRCPILCNGERSGAHAHPVSASWSNPPTNVLCVLSMATILAGHGNKIKPPKKNPPIGQRKRACLCLWLLRSHLLPLPNFLLALPITLTTALGKLVATALATHKYLGKRQAITAGIWLLRPFQHKYCDPEDTPRCWHSTRSPVLSPRGVYNALHCSDPVHLLVLR